jgi:hypothetical protein
MTNFLAVLFWGLAILGALAGWGRLLATVLRLDPPVSIPAWLEAPAWGLAVSCFLGGFLNLFSLANYTGVFLYLLAGVGFFLFFALSSLRKNLPRLRAWRPVKSDFPALALLTLILFVLFLRFSSSVVVDSYHPDLPGFANNHFNPHDDAHAYLVFPARLLQTGSLGQDPFNSRLLMSGLGAQYFLNAFVLDAFPPDNIHLLEGGVGLAAAVFAAGALALRLRLGRFAVGAFMLVPLAVESLFINTTSQMTGVAVFLALASALFQLFSSSPPRRSTIILAALLLAAACALKSTVIPTAVGFVALASVFQSISTRCVRPLLDVFLIGLLAVACLAPWMLWQYRSSGTPLYPLLGLGDHIEAYHPSPPAPLDPRVASELTHGLILPITLFLLVIIISLLPKIRARSDSAHQAFAALAAAFLLAWIFAWPALALSTENIDTARYLAVSRAAGLVLFLAFVWSLGRQLSPAAPAARLLGPLIFALILLGLSPEWSANYFTYLPRDLSDSRRDAVYQYDNAIANTQAMQSSVPPGENLLVYLQAPFLLDFTRNPIFVADWPGEASPPPGLPVAAGPEPVAAYLLAHGIRYVAYSYRTEANFPRHLFANYLNPINGRVVRRTTANAFAFQDDLTQLAQSRARLFDNGDTWILDLAAPKKPLLK